MNKEQITIFWFRRDLRLNDNIGLYQALKNGYPVLPLFIFDTSILSDLDDKTDKRVDFIYRELKAIHENLIQAGSSLLVKYGKPLQVWKEILEEFQVGEVYTNRDYEPYAKARDENIRKLLDSQNIPFKTYKDQVIFEKKEVLKDNNQPYVVFTPYKNRWLDTLSESNLASVKVKDYFNNFMKTSPIQFPKIEEIGFRQSDFHFPSKEINKEIIQNYHKTRDYPATDGTSRLGIHLRFGTISIRKLAGIAQNLNQTFLSELVWREFYMMILWHFPHVVDQPFKPKYAKISWRNNKQEFERWCEGTTGYPMVDAGMRELNQTGYVHNRVRMITASFLTKHLLTDWRWGERYFAKKLLDYELASNNGNWQWAAGCGCDAAPYFRIFNPTTQIKKFDPEHQYIKKWNPELESDDYPAPIVEHKFARERALEVFKNSLSQ